MNLDDYPRAKRFLEEHPEMTLDQAIDFLKQQLEAKA